MAQHDDNKKPDGLAVDSVSAGSQSCQCHRCGWEGHMFDTMHTEDRVTTIYCPNCPDHKDDKNSLSVRIIHQTENIEDGGA